MNRRRKILGLLIIGILSPFLPVRGAVASRSDVRKIDELIRVLAELLPDNPAMHRLCRTARQHYGSVDASSAAANRLFGDLRSEETPTTEQLRTHLQSLRDADFAAGDTLTVDGWMLARSEAEAIALVAAHRGA